MNTNEQGLFEALRIALKASKQPLDCHALYELPSVNACAASANRVSDYLGALWRKGQVVRLPASREEGSRARWAYEWKDKAEPSSGMPYAPRVLADRPTLVITEEGNTIRIEMAHLVISIQAR